ncbi:NAD(P)/FAD-dependent oxidoreductase [Aspergillus fijiensis CBS 313.89]|uniref:FAD dependent oxidoreductase superfamily n=1 Tax=Aspergillus fijiensis CBS 313.89 TaxID=1448319 RepID=A0A8G1RZC9_9EURO|nr:FAD dependent oxidoreductase superfamily [Aspergillus fijiensis CBS 313.89]RAK81537.1 FAD dependent oxidoreductase superfamily [Aspergillus fijiensis CBS 313.89]
MPTSTCFPGSNPGECFWQNQPHELHNFRSTEQLPEQSEVVIIGAGYAGTSTAYHLLRDHGDAIKSITILEARGACSGATGRNGGHLRPDFYGHIPTYIDRAGVRAGAEIAEFEISHLHAMKKLIEEEQIDCDFTLTRSIDVWCNEEAAQKAKTVYDRMRSLNLDYMNDVVFYTGKDVEGICGVKGAKACASFTAGTMWPYKFILHLLKSALASGKVNLQTFTPAQSITPAPHGGFTVQTPRGSLHAATVIHANNAYVAGLLPEYAKNIVPCKGICCRITVPAGTTAPLLNNSYINRTEDNTLSYLIPRADGSIVVGGASSKFRPFKEQWYNNVDDSELIDAAKDYYDGYMQRTYRGWENAGAKVDQIWTGVMGYSYDSNPHIGAVPGKEGQFILAGFNGHGMPVIWRSAQELARMVVQKIPFEETCMPRLFQTSQFRIDRAMNGSEDDGDILGTGNFPSTKP